MGGKPSSSAEEAPQFDPAAAEKLCKEAYAAGAFDASMHYQALLDSQWRFDAAATAGGCAATLLLSYMYFSTRMAQAVQHLEAERALVARLQHESGEMSAQWDRLVEANTRQLDLLQRHEAALRTARRRQAELRHVVAKLRRRGKCLACEVNALKSSIAQLRQHVTVVCCGGGVALGCLSALSASALVVASSRERREPVTGEVLREQALKSVADDE